MTPDDLNQPATDVAALNRCRQVTRAMPTSALVEQLAHACVLDLLADVEATAKGVEPTERPDTCGRVALREELDLRVPRR